MLILFIALIFGLVVLFLLLRSMGGKKAVKGKKRAVDGIHKGIKIALLVVVIVYILVFIAVILKTIFL